MVNDCSKLDGGWCVGDLRVSVKLTPPPGPPPAGPPPENLLSLSALLAGIAAKLVKADVLAPDIPPPLVGPEAFAVEIIKETPLLCRSASDLTFFI